MICGFSVFFFFFKFVCVCVFVFVTLAYAILCTRCFVVHWSDWLTRDLVILVVIQNGVKIFRFVGFKNKGKNYSVQSKTFMDG